MDRAPASLTGVEKCASGIEGLDEITAGGLPRGRPTLVCGSAGCGKTLLGMEFLIHGARRYQEAGVFVSFEEPAGDLAKNVASLGVDLHALEAAGQLLVRHIPLDRNEIEVVGDFDLEGLFIQLASAIDAVGARRIVLDTIETLFASFPNEAILRSELRRLFQWLKDRGLTAIVTGERGEKTLTRHGLEEYVADCVILLDHRISEQIATRRLRIVKYRGSVHGADEYPFLIDEQGIAVLPITTLGLQHGVSSERISTSVARLDAMLGGAGLYRGSTVLYSGTAGSGKTSLAASFGAAACRRGERVLYLAFEESQPQIVRNMRSIGLDLQQWIDAGLLTIIPKRATACGLELHLVAIHKAVRQVRPQVVVIDPMSNLVSVGSRPEVKAMLTRLIDLLKASQITAVFTSLTREDDREGTAASQMASLVDAWLLLSDVEGSGERNRLLQLVKARGLEHSNQLREFLITGQGIELRDVYLGAGGVLTGTARQVQEADEAAAKLERVQEVQARRRDLERRRESVEARIMALRAESAADFSESEARIAQAERREALLAAGRLERETMRQADATGAEPTHG